MPYVFKFLKERTENRKKESTSSQKIKVSGVSPEKIIESLKTPQSLVLLYAGLNLDLTQRIDSNTDGGRVLATAIVRYR